MSTTIDSLAKQIKSFSRHLKTIKDIYAVQLIENKLKDGKVRYPLQEKSDWEQGGGAEIKFWYVKVYTSTL